ncbi:endonuclease/exonuclease/phosphatase family protein [Streptomyces sp. NPDC055078]
MTTVRMLACNVEKGINWVLSADWIRDQDPDIVFQQEVQPGQLHAQAARMGMTGYIAPSRSGSNDNAIFVKNSGPLVVTEEYRQDWAPWHAPANIAVTFRDPDGALSPRQISCVSGHACYWSPEHRLTEARWCSTLAKPGWLSIHFWDWNSYRADEMADGWWEGYDDHAFVANRTYTEGGRRRTDDRPDRELTAAGYIEMARYAADHLGQSEAMNPTAGYRTHPGRPDAPLYSIDRGYLSRELAPALTGFTVADTPLLRRLADHLPLIATFDGAALHSILHADTPRYTPHTEHASPRSSSEGIL